MPSKKSWSQNYCLLNETHLSTIVCPVTTNVEPDINILRIHLSKLKLDQLSDVLIDQIRAIDNKRLIQRIGKLTQEQSKQLRKNIAVVLDL